jgi:hypothetical protein
MTFLLIFLGIILMALGFFMVWRTNLLVQWFGDLSLLTGVNWLSWKIVGLAFMLFGFLLATNLFSFFLYATVGRLLLPGV